MSCVLLEHDWIKSRCLLDITVFSFNTTSRLETLKCHSYFWHASCNQNHQDLGPAKFVEDGLLAANLIETTSININILHLLDSHDVFMMHLWCLIFQKDGVCLRDPQKSMTSKVLLFSVLASVGNIQTFGLSNVWPELLRHESHGLHDFGPAMKLMVLVSVGIPVGGLCDLISHSKKASHKIYILFSGLLGCIGLACVAAWEHSSLLLLAMLITHMSGDPAGGSCGHWRRIWVHLCLSSLYETSNEIQCMLSHDLRDFWVLNFLSTSFHIISKYT